MGALVLVAKARPFHSMRPDGMRGADGREAMMRERKRYGQKDDSIG